MKPLLMGILNVTPDSFSDGGANLEPDVAIAAGLRMADEGADVIDVGGESTRPGSLGVTAAEELRRVLPVVKALCNEGVRVSIDTSKDKVASECVSAGAWMVNDVTALGGPSRSAMGAICSEAGCKVCLMHMRGTPASMQTTPQYEDVVGEVRSFLLERASWAEDSGIRRENIWIDPGIGFGKTVEHNLELLRRLDALVSTGYKVMIGVSRKSFLSKLGSDGQTLSVDERLEATLATQTIAQSMGVGMIRAHDVRAARRSIDAAAAVLATSFATGVAIID